MLKKLIFLTLCADAILCSGLLAEEPCRCYSVAVGGDYMAPYDVRTWPPGKISSYKMYFLDSIKAANSGIVNKVDYLDFTSDYDEYCEIYSKFRKQKLAIENKYADIEWYGGPTYPSKMQALFDYESALNEVLYDLEIAYQNFLLTHKKCRSLSLITGCKSLDPKIYDENIMLIEKKRKVSEKLRLEKTGEVGALFQEILSFCIKKHTNLRTYYEKALHDLNRGAYVSAIKTTQMLIEHATAKNQDEYLKAETYIQLGIACSMSLEYSQAIEALTDALKKDPGNSEAYVERAISYFESGNFDLALKDFLASGSQFKGALPEDPNHLQFALGFAKGGSFGLIDGAKEMPASLMHTIGGVGRLLWAGVTHPVNAYAEVSESVHEMITYLRSQDAVTIAKNMVPELKELLHSWDSLKPHTRGEKAGYILGKYGLEVIIPGATMQAIKKYQHLRRANALCTLETMAASAENRVILEKLAREASLQRDQFFKNVTIHADKQGKHIVGHKNYDPKLGQQYQPSVLNHASPEQLLRDHAGQGSPRATFTQGQGYREAVDFKQYIGEFFDKETGKFHPTTRGTIHYDKNGGAHIVPASPDIP